MSNKQIGGNHYRNLNIQPWDAMESWMPIEEFKGYLRGNAIKYLARAGKKGNDKHYAYRQDIEKAHHYLEKLVSVCETEAMKEMVQSIEELFSDETSAN